MRIDFHFHLAAREHMTPAALAFCDSFWTRRGDWNDILASSATVDAYIESEGLDYAVGLAEISPGVTGVTTNEYVLERYGDSKRLILFANVNPHVHDDPAALVHLLADRGFRGVKLYPTYQHFYPNDLALWPFYAACAERGWPVMVHTGSSIFPGAKIKYGDPVCLDDVVVDFPGLNMLIVHGGRGLWYDRAAFLAQLHPNLYLEVSGLPPQNLMNYFPNFARIGHKVIFGSDFPGNPGIRANMEAIARLPLTSETVDLILGGTAAKLLHL